MRTLKGNKHYVIDTTKAWHVAWWAEELGVSEAELLAAVDIVGNTARAVEFHLRLVGKVPARRRRSRSRNMVSTIEI